MVFVVFCIPANKFSSFHSMIDPANPLKISMFFSPKMKEKNTENDCRWWKAFKHLWKGRPDLEDNHLIGIHIFILLYIKGNGSRSFRFLGSSDSGSWRSWAASDSPKVSGLRSERSSDFVSSSWCCLIRPQTPLSSGRIWGDSRKAHPCCSGRIHPDPLYPRTSWWGVLCHETGWTSPADCGTPTMIPYKDCVRLPQLPLCCCDFPPCLRCPTMTTTAAFSWEARLLGRKRSCFCRESSSDDGSVY